MIIVPILYRPQDPDGYWHQALTREAEALMRAGFRSVATISSCYPREQFGLAATSEGFPQQSWLLVRDEKPDIISGEAV